MVTLKSEEKYLLLKVTEFGGRSKASRAHLLGQSLAEPQNTALQVKAITSAAWLLKKDGYFFVH